MALNLRRGTSPRAPWLPTVAIALAITTAGCRGAPPPRAGTGRRVAEGQVLALRPSPDGAFLAFLDRCQPQKDRTLPPGTAACDLSVVPEAGGERVAVAKGVTTLLPGFAWSGQGHALAALDGYDHTKGTGALVVWSGGAPRRLAAEVGFYALSRDGARVGYAAAGRLFLAATGEAPAEIAGAEGVTSFEFGGPGGDELLARRSTRSGGELLAIRGGRAAPLAAAVRDYGYARNGARFAFTAGAPLALAILPAGATRTPPALARDVQTFLFSPAGDAIAYVADASARSPGRPVGGAARGRGARAARRACGRAALERAGRPAGVAAGVSTLAAGPGPSRWAGPG